MSVVCDGKVRVGRTPTTPSAYTPCGARRRSVGTLAGPGCVYTDGISPSMQIMTTCRARSSPAANRFTDTIAARATHRRTANRRVVIQWHCLGVAQHWCIGRCPGEPKDDHRMGQRTFRPQRFWGRTNIVSNSYSVCREWGNVSARRQAIPDAADTVIRRRSLVDAGGTPVVFLCAIA